jgi:hypothetical protein
MLYQGGRGRGGCPELEMEAQAPSPFNIDFGILPRSVQSQCAIVLWCCYKTVDPARPAL